MKSGQKIDLGLTGYDELFMNDQERAENKLPRIYDIPLSEIDPFPDHPFQVRMDEDKLLSTMRSREISVSIIIQNLAQLKALFEKQWESIVGNCDEFLYLGGNEQSTHEYVSKLLGKETIDMNTYGQSKGRNGSYSTNWQLTGRELMMPDEVRKLKNRYALLFVRGEDPIQDDKYDIMRHPNIKLTTDGGSEPYRHGEDLVSIADFVFDEETLKNASAQTVGANEYLFFTDEEFEQSMIKRMEELKNENQKQEQPVHQASYAE